MRRLAEESSHSVLIELVEPQTMRLNGTLPMENGKNTWTDFDENGIVVCGDARLRTRPPPSRTAR
jgi:hypothetical protein